MYSGSVSLLQRFAIASTKKRKQEQDHFEIERRTLSGPVELLAGLARLHVLISSYHSLSVDLAAARSSWGIAWF